MSTLIESYNQVALRLQEFNEKISSAESEINRLQSSFEGDSAIRIAKLEEQLEKIDDYQLRVKGFQELAKKNLDSQNVLTIEAPPGYRVNLNRLRNWAMMIDPTSSNDPYAQRVYVVAKCDEFFLEKKKKEFTERIAMLKSEQSSGSNAEIEQLQKDISTWKEELEHFALSDEIREFSKKVVSANKMYWRKKSPAVFKNNADAPDFFAPGAYAAPFHFDANQNEILKTAMGDFYDAEGGRVLLPVEISNRQEYVMSITCAPSRRKNLDKALQNLVLTTLNESPAGLKKVYVLDGVRFNSASMGTLRQLEDTFVMAQIPRNPEQLTSTLEQIVFSFADTDEVLELYDSVSEYNASVEKSKKLQSSLIILYGWPGAYSGRDRELLQRIMTNYERYGISFITVRYQNADKKETVKDGSMPEYAWQNAIHIKMRKAETTIAFPESAEQKFTWYTFNGELSEAYVKNLLAFSNEEELLGSEYVKRVNMVEYPPYERGKKSLVLPYGVDAKDEVHTLSFDNENFASYLMGASGSGKSTLLHTLITGIIRNYHPDDVELWLADFKMSEFAQYIDPMPPHVKYILLDESRELVFDLIDKLTEKMMERQRFFMQAENRNYKKVENVPTNIYMPVIFVILDEFSIMSQAVAEAESYKLKLQNLLAKGRALGIKFIFSSQTFTTGIMGLTKTAKEQIQMRIAMKNSKNEIDQTLELSSETKTAQVRNWIDALPPHFALTKYREGDKMYVKRVNVMYFDGKGDEALEPQRKMIRFINDKMQSVDYEEYEPQNLECFVNKNPVVVDGNSFEKYDVEKCEAERRKILKSDDYNGDEIFAYLGSPRLMYSFKEIAITPESRQNLLLIGDSSERSCSAAVITSAMESFIQQGKEVEIWTYDRDKLYRVYCESTWGDYSVISDMKEICTSIKTLRKALQDGEQLEEKLIVLLGFENVCADFEFVAGQSVQKSRVKVITNEAVQQMQNATIDESQEDEESKERRKLFMELQKLNSLTDEEAEEDDEEDEFIDVQSMDFSAYVKQIQAQMAGNSTEVPIGESKETSQQSVEESTITKDNIIEENKAEEEQEESKENGLYNAREDFKFCVQQGSRKGVHFLAYFTSYADLKQTGLKLEWFKHRLAFKQSSDDSKILFNTNAAVSLPEHICLYSDMLERFSFRPYLHKGISWDGWGIDDEGNVINPMSSNG